MGILFQAGKTRRRRKLEEEDAVSRASMESGPGAEVSPADSVSPLHLSLLDQAVREEADGRSTGSREEGSGEERGGGEEQEERVNLGSHSDVGYASRTEVPGVEEEGERKKSGEGGERRRELERQRSCTIVRPPVEEGEERDETSPVNSNQEEEEEKTPGPVRYTDIRSKFPGLLNKDQKAGTARNLFSDRKERKDSSEKKERRDSSESCHLEEKVRGYLEGSSRAASEAPTTTSQRYQSCS